MKVLMGIAGFLLLAGTANATEPSVWQGDLFITAVTTACTNDDVASAGDFTRAVYQPHLSGTSDIEGLALYGTRSTLLLQSPSDTGHLSGAVSYDGTFVSSHATEGSYSSNSHLTITPSPTAIKATTPVVRITGTINNYFDLSGCDVTVVGELGLRPE